MLVISLPRALAAVGAAVLAAALLLVAIPRLAWAGGGGGAAAPPAAITHVPTGAPDVAITFDDGPDPLYTPRMLAVLRQHAAVATFFVLGQQVARFPNVVRAEAAEGSEVCNHGYSHRMLRGRSPAFVTRDVGETKRMLDRLGVPPCPLFRFPYFASDGVARATVAGLGYRIVGANVDTEDWRQPNPGRTAERVLTRLQPGDIVLLHDGGGPRQRTLTILTLLLQGLQTRGLHAVTVSQLLATVPQGRPPAASED